ncbi:GDP-mannose 4,6-dehydratase [Candidatus Woesearchaeota archaeon]|nr:GDP-mannose 4,6-dehydratase [Candidatus Woesearchaeota archaeon]
MKALITGAEGFVGYYLIKELLSQGYDVTGTNIGEIPENTKKLGIAFFKLDILDRNSVKKTFNKLQPDAVFHLAAISSVKFSMDNPELTMKVNVEGTKNILEAAFGLKNNSKVLVIGSANEYGIPESVPITEKHKLNPLSPYAESKVECEKLAKKYAEKGLNAIIVRSFNHIGPGQSEQFVCSAFAKQIADIEKGNEPVIKVGNLSAKRDFTDVRDVVKAYALAVKKCDSGSPYNICSGKAFSIQEILESLLRLSKVKVEIKKDPLRMRKSDIPVLLGDNSRFSGKTGWLPEIPIEQSLKDILEFWRNRN